MANDWVHTKLGDIFKVKHGFAFKGEYFSDAPTNSFLLTPGNFSTSGGFQDIKPKYYDGPIPDDYILKPSQVVVTMTDLSKQSDTLGYAVSIPNDGKVWLHNQRTGLLEFKKEYPSDPLFISYLLRSHEYRSWIIGSATGTTVKHTSPTRIHDFECKIPPLSEQKAIAYILGSLDDKIELNRQMNETLEAMAQALFKSWFVDFDPVIDNALAAGNAIPDEFAERAEQRKGLEKKDNADIQKLFPDAFEFTEEMGWIPLGWDVDGFKNIVEKYIDNRGKTPPLSEFGIPLIEVKHISDYEIKPSLDTTKFVDRDTYNSWFRSYLQTDDIIISTVGTIGRICMVANGEEFAIAQNLLGFRFKKTSVLPSFMYYQMDGFRFRHDVDARLVTTVQASIKRKDLETISLLIPSIKVQKAFEVIVKPLMNKQNSNQNIQLAKLRDTLLPKLMSGELRIPDADAMTKEV